MEFLIVKVKKETCKNEKKIAKSQNKWQRNRAKICNVEIYSHGIHKKIIQSGQNKIMIHYFKDFLKTFL